MGNYYVTELSQKAKYYNIPLPKVSRIDKIHGNSKYIMFARAGEGVMGSY